jgi:hypothetical protein
MFIYMFFSDIFFTSTKVPTNKKKSNVQINFAFFCLTDIVIRTTGVEEPEFQIQNFKKKK